MNEQSKPVPFAPGLAVWSPIWVRDEGRYDLELRVVYEAGRFVVDELTVKRRTGGPPVTSEGIREIPVAALLRRAVEGQLMHVGPPIRGEGKTSWEMTWAGPVTLSERAQGGGGPSDADLRAVADVYHVAYATGGPPLKTVMNRLGLPRSTASRWIRMARERGLLGPATPRKAGG
jgi:hypothetical protein